jgi:hypothetical protein
MVSSADGFCSVVTFDVNELGRPLSSVQKSQFLSKYYPFHFLGAEPPACSSETAIDSADPLILLPKALDVAMDVSAN